MISPIKVRRRQASHGLTAEQRLARESYLHPVTGCRIWTGLKTPAGYGMITFKGRNYGAHRLAWMAAHGPIPSGKVICHHCDVRRCINPDHLFLGTQGHNMLDLAHKRSLRRLQLPPALAADQPTQQILWIVLRGVELLRQAIDLIERRGVPTADAKKSS